MQDMVPQLRATWLAKLSRLAPATGRGECWGKAPHKPLLLLSIFDVIESREQVGPTIVRCPGIILRFQTYGGLVADRWPTRLDLRMPLFHLKTQGFWAPLAADGSPARSKDDSIAVTLDPDFFRMAIDPAFRLDARLLLISTYFESSEQIALLESMDLGAYRKEDHPRRTRIIEETSKAAERKGRTARFAVQVVSQYRYTCALTGLQCLTADGATIVDAAHIDPWSKSQNDSLTNGLALCKNAHWSFDQGLWSVNEHGTIVTAPQRFTETGPEALCLSAYTNRPLTFASMTTLRPDPIHFIRHRERWGFDL